MSKILQPFICNMFSPPLTAVSVFYRLIKKRTPSRIEVVCCFGRTFSRLLANSERRCVIKEKVLASTGLCLRIKQTSQTSSVCLSNTFSHYYLSISFNSFLALFTTRRDKIGINQNAIMAGCHTFIITVCDIAITTLRAQIVTANPNWNFFSNLSIYFYIYFTSVKI